MKVAASSTWNREERTKPRTIVGLAEYFKNCGIPISHRYLTAALKSGGYSPQYGTLTTADHFLHWKSTSDFKCRFPKNAAKAPR